MAETKLPFHSSDFFLNSEEKRQNYEIKTQNYGFFCFFNEMINKKGICNFSSHNSDFCTFIFHNFKVIILRYKLQEN